MGSYIEEFEGLQPGVLGDWVGLLSILIGFSLVVALIRRFTR